MVLVHDTIQCIKLFALLPFNCVGVCRGDAVSALIIIKQIGIDTVTMLPPPTAAPTQTSCRLAVHTQNIAQSALYIKSD